MRGTRALIVAALTLTTFNPVTGDAAAPPCPSPRTCSLYTLQDYRWQVGASERLVIDYRVNTRNPWVTPRDVPEMVRSAARVWEVANPRISFRYRGTTDALPGIEDGVNVIGWGHPLLPGEAGRAELYQASDGGYVDEADIVLNVSAFTRWQRCQQRDNACAGHTSDSAPGVWFSEIQAVVTHELGHWLSIDHVDGPAGEHLTMTPTIDTVRGLEYQTLGLGDILGARAAYPCGKCGGAPRVFVP